MSSKGESERQIMGEREEERRKKREGVRDSEGEIPVSLNAIYQG